MANDERDTAKNIDGSWRRKPERQSERGRMKKTLASVMFLMLNVPIAALADDAFLCIADKSTGFEFNETSSQWDYVRFNVANKKYILKKQSKGWLWTDFGQTESHGFQCDEINQDGYIICHDGPRELRLFPKTLRFQIISPNGYIGGFAALGVNGTPYIEIGTCSTL